MNMYSILLDAYAHPVVELLDYMLTQYLTFEGIARLFVKVT